MEENEIKILIFNLNGESFATEIKDVERILGYVSPTDVPDVPSFVEGVINHENSILPIINLNKKFKFSAIKSENELENKKIVVIKREEKKFGVIVDTVEEVCDVSSEVFEEAPQITVTDMSKKYIKGLLKLDGRIVILLKIGDILTEEEENLIF
jgi:purine-binding chemotaxis protein CheW